GQVGRLGLGPELWELLYHWKTWGNAEEVAAWVNRPVASPDGAVSFTRAFTREVRTSDLFDRVARVHQQVNLTEIERFIAADKLEAALSNVDRAHATGRDALALRAFDRAMDRRRK